MIKNFTVTLPDEPYKTTTALNRTVECKYTGPRYLSICVNNNTGEVKYVARTGETIEDLEFESLIDDDPSTTFHIIDAGEHPFEASYLTHNYEHGEVEDFTVKHPGDLGSWTYHYDDGTGAIDQCFYCNDLKYIDGKFQSPGRREHALTRESFLEGCKNIAAVIENSLKNNDYSAEDQAKLEEHIEWLKAVPSKYANIDHWKIPFPSDVPRYY
jgi:hypothetical protein